LEDALNPDSPTPFGFAGLTEAERESAYTCYRKIRPYLEEHVSLSEVARLAGIDVRTAWRWVRRYRLYGLSGLCRKARFDRAKVQQSTELQQIIEGLALQKPRLSAAAIHRKVRELARQHGEPAPSYSTVYSVVRQIAPPLAKMAHEGTKAYNDTFDLLYRREASGPNAIWQADHTQLDVTVLDKDRCARRPWLTAIMDDYSRAIAGYALSFNAPSAMQTALALRQAIWRKAQPSWQVCGIPEVLYTDHGSDFTSQHIEQVVAELKIRLIFSTVGCPRGRGKVERFFATVNQVFLPQLPRAANGATTLSLAELTALFESYVLEDYNREAHATTRVAPQEHWLANGFLPQMPSSLEQLDLLLLTVPKLRRVQQDGIRFMGFRYISATLAAYVGEEVLVRYDPRDIAEVRLFHRDRFLCRAICQELAGETVALRDIVRARNSRRHQLRQTLEERRRVVDALLETRRWTMPDNEPAAVEPRRRRELPVPKLKRYRDE